MVHSHSLEKSTRNLKVAFFINVSFTCIEIIGGIFTNSIAIVSDALHDLGDSLSLGLAWFLEKKAQTKEPTDKFSFGFVRLRVLGALINALVLIGGSVYIIIEAIERFQNPEPVRSTWMMIIAIIGVVANGYAFWRTKGAKSLNELVVSWHLLEDVLGWIAVLIVSIVLQFNDWYFLDPALSIGITSYILFGVSRRLWDTIYILMQGVPTHMDVDIIKKKLLAIKHVKSIHHLHIWSLDGEHHVLTTHLVLDNISDYKEIEKVQKAAIDALREFNFSHYTIQIELDDKTCKLGKN